LVVLRGSEYKSEGIRYKFIDPTKVPNLTSTVASFAFGSVPLGSTVNRNASLTNNGTGELLITSLKQGHLLFSVDRTGPITLGPRQSLSFNAGFAPATSETAATNLVIRSNNATQASLSYPMSGTGSTTFGDAPLKVYFIQQSGPLDNTIAMRFSLQNSATTPIRASDYKLVYYFADWRGLSSLVWDTYYTTANGTIGAQLRKIVAKTAGLRTADSALELTFPEGAVIAPGQALIVEGKLHHLDWTWTFNENDDWSWYQRSDQLAENVVVQNIATEAVVFGSSPAAS
jgi:hypothetical protein